MAEAHHRKKAPDEVRRRLIAAGITLAAESGADAVTVDAVSRMAGVSKGGFQHHFPSRRALLDALFEEIWGRFQKLWDRCVEQDAEPVGRLSRAYLHTNDTGHTEEMRSLSRASLAFTLSDDEFRRRWAERTSDLLPNDEAPTLEGQAKLLICRLAADGLWLAELLGVHAPSPELRAELVRQLDALTKES